MGYGIWDMGTLHLMMQGFFINKEGKMEVEYTNDLIRKMQLIELDMLKEVDRICRENNIKYEIDGGTLLGAVRHGGFIPWDDDIDIRMLRKDYDKFCDVCMHNLDGDKYFLQTYETDKGYLWEYARILRNNTSFYRKNQEMLKMKRGIFIDIFPYDGMPSNSILKSIFNFKCLIARKILYSRVGCIHEKNVIKKVGYTILSKVPTSLAYKIFESLREKYRNVDTQLVRTMGWNFKADSMGFPRKWMENVKEIQFENLVVYAPENAEEFLKFMYGEDFMTLPPIEKRVLKHPATDIMIEQKVYDELGLKEEK